AGAALAGVLALRRPAAGAALAARVAATVVATALLAAAYALTPFSAFGARGAPVGTVVNTRYGVPALLLALAATAWLAGRVGRVRLLVEVAGLAAIADAIRRGFAPVEVGHIAVAAALVAAGAVGVVAWVRW